MLPASSPTECVPLNPIVTTEEENKEENDNFPAVEECVRSIQEIPGSKQANQRTSFFFTNSLVMHAI